jgi:chaperonin GroEL
MASKILLFDTEARAKLGKGIDTLANAVKATLGPKGRNVVFSRTFGGPSITKDGVTVAREIWLKDQFENMGAQMVREVAAKTVNTAGDGTTTATVLAQAIFREGNKFVTAGANPMDLKRGIDKAVAHITNHIYDKAYWIDLVTDKERVAQIADISGNADSEIGNMLVQAFEKVGVDGVISLEEAKSTHTELEIAQGMEFDRGYISPFFVTDPAKMVANLQDCYVFLYSKKIAASQPLLKLLDQVARHQRPILIIAEDIEGDALSTLVVNKARGLINAVAVKAPAFGERRKDIMEDIAVLTGATVITEDFELKLEKTTIEHLGVSKKVTVTRDSTTIIEGRSNPEALQARVELIKSQIEVATNDYDRNKLKERLSKLTGGAAIIKIGAYTETELREKKDRYDDALHAIRAALDKGIVSGGGVEYLKSQSLIEDLALLGDQKLGGQIVYNALEEPIRIICKNAGLEPSVIINKIKESEDPGAGFDACSGYIVNSLEVGIIDPAKVVCSALQNASSIAGLLLTTEVAITDDLEDKNPSKENELPLGSNNYRRF